MLARTMWSLLYTSTNLFGGEGVPDVGGSTEVSIHIHTYTCTGTGTCTVYICTYT